MAANESKVIKNIWRGVLFFLFFIIIMVMVFYTLLILSNGGLRLIETTDALIATMVILFTIVCVGFLMIFNKMGLIEGDEGQKNKKAIKMFLVSSWVSIVPVITYYILKCVIGTPQTESDLKVISGLLALVVVINNLTITLFQLRGPSSKK